MATMTKINQSKKNKTKKQTNKKTKHKQKQTQKQKNKTKQKTRKTRKKKEIWEGFRGPGSATDLGPSNGGI